MSADRNRIDRRRHGAEDLVALADDLNTAVERITQAGFPIAPSVLGTFERAAQALEMDARDEPPTTEEEAPTAAAEAAIDRTRSALEALNARLGLS